VRAVIACRRRVLRVIAQLVEALDLALINCDWGNSRDNRCSIRYQKWVQIALPPTGTTKLLEELSTFIPDEFINGLLAAKAHPGTKHHFSPAQLWRTHLLALLTPAHSFNGIVRLLPEQRQWRRFARLNHRHRNSGCANAS